MKNLKGERTDLVSEKNSAKYDFNNVNVSETKIQNELYHLIYYPNMNSKKDIKKVLAHEIDFFLMNANIKNYNHIFIAGLGNDNHTADSVGPKTLKKIKVNAYLEKLDIKLNHKITALEPGVLSETGIETGKIIKSIVDDIKPDLIILIDSFITESIDYLNHTIEISNYGLNAGSGIRGLNDVINSKLLGVPVIVIGVATAIEIKINSKKKDNSFAYLLSTNDVDIYVKEISSIIGESINQALHLG